jgi:hypothetical protein
VNLARRPRRGLLTAATATSIMLLTAGTADADLSQGRLQTITDQYLFSTSLDRFVSIRAEKPYADQLDWSSDSCSYSPDNPLGFDFGSSCNRHDFGYRNYKKQDRFTENNRLKIDNNFKADMYSQCGDNVACKGTANVYYEAVRRFGASSTSVADALGKAQIAQSPSHDISGALAPR